MSEEEAINQVQEELKHNQKIAEDAKLFHQVINDPSIADPNFTQEEFVNRYSSLFSVFGNSESILSNLYNRLKQIYIEYKGNIPNSIVKRNVNLTAKTKDGVEILGHIDQLIIGEDGSLHLFLFKTTSDSRKDWVGVKREKYDF